MMTIEETAQMALYYKDRALNAEADLCVMREKLQTARDRGAFDFFQAAMGSEFVDNETQLQIADAYFEFSGTSPETLRERIKERARVPMSAGQLNKVINLADYR